MRLNRFSPGLALLLICVASACDKKAEQPITAPPQQNNAVSWYDGYTMPTLLAQPLKLASTSDLSKIDNQKWYAEFKVHTDANPAKIITLSSCNDYLAQPNAKLQTLNEKDNTPFMEIALMCRATQMLRAATKPEQSYLQSLQFNESLPSLLPAKFAMVVSASEQARIDADKSRKHWRDVTPITRFETLGPFHANYHHAGGAQELALVARGDFNNDKIEDMLITSRDSVAGGSYGAIRLFLITRTSAAGDIAVLNEYKR